MNSLTPPTPPELSTPKPIEQEQPKEQTDDEKREETRRRVLAGLASKARPGGCC